MNSKTKKKNSQNKTSLTKSKKTTKAKIVNDKKVKDTTSSKKDQLSIYYESILEKVEKLLDEDKSEEALEIINDELEAPYMPSEYLTKFEELFSTISAEVRYLKKSVKYESWTRLELLDESFKNNSLNETALSFLLERYGSDLEISELKIFDSFFANKNTSPFSKQNLFMLLKSVQLNYDFDFYNVFLGKMYKINTTTSNTIFDSKYFISLKEIIENFTFKEPALNEFCNLLIFDIYLYNFPNDPDFDINDLSYAIFQYMLNSLQGGIKEYKNPEIISYLDNIIKAIEDKSKQ